MMPSTATLAPATSALVMRLRVLTPVIGVSVVVLTLVTCLILTKTRDIYTGGLKWPYFSDMGRDAPEYYIFCVGLTLAAIALACTWVFNFQFQRAVLSRPIQLGQIKRSTHTWAFACTVLGTISVVGLPVLAYFSTSTYPTTHNYAAYWFFFLETIAVFINTGVSWTIFRHASSSRDLPGFISSAGGGASTPNEDVQRIASLRRTFRIQIVFTTLFFIAFLLYLPIGLAIVADFKHLTIAECLERNLGVKYCTDSMRKNDTETKLWNYEDDFSKTQMRAAAQLGCILTLVGYSVSFLSHDFAREVDNQDLQVRGNEPSTHFYTIPMLNSPLPLSSDDTSENHHTAYNM